MRRWHFLSRLARGAEFHWPMATFRSHWLADGWVLRQGIKRLIIASLAVPKRISVASLSRSQLNENTVSACASDGLLSNPAAADE